MEPAWVNEANECLQIIRRDFSTAQRSWALFVEANGESEGHRGTLHEALNRTYAVNSFNHIIDICITNCVLALCRMSDHKSGRRVNFLSLKALFSTNREDFSPRAAMWFEDSTLPCEVLSVMISASVDAAVKGRDFVIKHAGRTQNRNDFKAVRSLRDHALAHTISADFIRPRVVDIESCLKHCDEIITQADLALRGNDLGNSDALSIYRSYAKEFWDYLEAGLDVTDKFE